MRVDEQELRKFLQLYECEFGEQVTLEDASEIAERLVVLYEMLAKPLEDEEPSGKL
jgi:hypothetical protein